MKIKSIKIENLFDIFNYDISIENTENIIIITGPNGFGKTMILNIIFNLFNKNYLFFHKLHFDKIILTLDKNYKIEILKSGVNNEIETTFEIKNKSKTIEKFAFTSKILKEYEILLERHLSAYKIRNDEWAINNAKRTYTFDELIIEFSDELPNLIFKDNIGFYDTEAKNILDSIQVHLIKEQRLFTKVQVFEGNYRREKNKNVMVETIQTYSNELKQLVSEYSQKSFIQTQELDSSYPKRLRTESNVLGENEYNQRYTLLKRKLENLTKFGLYESKQELLTYSDEDAKALTVYLKDFELKLKVFDNLLEKLELFSNILNERRFTFKSVNINREKGFFFKTSKGKELELNQLSSGEQHEVVLLYELIFNVKSNVLVLIDEPEISLHITWQKDFLKDLISIIKLQDIQVLIATHSPSIINDRWDLVYNLEDNQSIS